MPVPNAASTYHRSIGPADRPNPILNLTVDKGDRGPKAHELYLKSRAYKV